MTELQVRHSNGSCFVVMPFGGLWDDYYREVYAPAAEQAGLRAVRADDVFGAGSILQRIVEAVVEASVVLVDITESNRNVHYELGWRMPWVVPRS